jgi:hypothetical protein
MRKHFQVLVCALLLTAVACKGKEPAQPPVATPSVTLNKDKAAIGSPLKITYKFQVLPNAKFDGDYAVFVHVMDPEGEKLWQDDHHPPTPTSQWQPGQTVEYTRTVFVPPFPYVGEATIRLGLYNPATGKRLALQAQEVSRHEYALTKFQLLPQSENIWLVVREGWHPQEIDPNNPTSEWTWTKKRAVLAFRNPKRDSTFYIEWDARIDLFNPPQQVTVSIGGQPIGTFAADSKERKLTTFPISAAQFGSADMVEIAIEVDRTFVAGGDTRELGLRVFHSFIEPK